MRGWLEDGSLKLEVAAPPEGGRANRAVSELLGAVLEIPRGRITVVGGAAARLKWVEVDGLSEAEVRRRIEKALVERETDDGK